MLILCVLSDWIKFNNEAKLASCFLFFKKRFICRDLFSSIYLSTCGSLVLFLGRIFFL